MEAIHFASCFPLSVWKRVVSLLARQHKNSIYCGNGSDTFRFLFPIVCVEASCFASCMHVNTKIEYIAGMEAKRFASCCPLAVWKRVVSLLARQHKNSIYCGNGSDTFRFLFPIVCVEASCFASCTSTQK